MTITLIFAALVALNFLLLVFSCNKISKKEVVKEIKPIKQRSSPVTTQLAAHQLAPTGS